jgi:hypothetical protein
MKALLTFGFMLLVSLTPSTSGAQGSDVRRGWVERDAQGRRVGTAEPQFGGGYVLHDPHGRRTGTLEPGSGGAWVRRDAQGRRVGTREPR